MVKDTMYYSIHGWMINQLNISGNELIIYAIIFGFSQDGKSQFQGSLKYLENASGSSRRTVQRSLESLCQKGFIRKVIVDHKGVQFNSYVSNDTPMVKMTQGMVKMTRGYGQNDTKGMVKMTPNNTIDKLIDNRERDAHEILKSESVEFHLEIIKKNSALPAPEFLQAIEKFCLDREEKGITYATEKQCLAGFKKWIMSWSTNYHRDSTKSATKKDEILDMYGEY